MYAQVHHHHYCQRLSCLVISSHHILFIVSFDFQVLRETLLLSKVFSITIYSNMIIKTISHLPPTYPMLCFSPCIQFTIDGLRKPAAAAAAGEEGVWTDAVLRHDVVARNDANYRCHVPLKWIGDVTFSEDKKHKRSFKIHVLCFLLERKLRIGRMRDWQ